MYQYRHFIPENIAPAGAKSIGVYDSDGNRVCAIPLGGLTPVMTAPLYRFALFADIHAWLAATSWDGNGKFDRALSAAENMGCVFAAHAGDFTQTGLYREAAPDTIDLGQFTAYRDICANHSIPIYGICGNHESYLKPITNNLAELREYTGTELYYSVQYADDVFVFLGQPSWDDVMGDDATAWLREVLAANTDRRCFLVIHSFIEEDSGDASDLRENSIFASWGASKTNAFLELLREHSHHIILFHGHSHIKFAWQSIDRNANYTERNGFRSVHIPSLGKPRDIDLENGTTPEDMAASEGYIVDVHADCIVLNGWNFVGDKPVPLGTYKIPT